MSKWLPYKGHAPKIVWNIPEDAINYFELEIYEPKGFFFLENPITDEDFILKTVLRLESLEKAIDCVKGLNASMKVVDAPYMPMRLYKVDGGKREKIWEQLYSRN